MERKSTIQHRFYDNDSCRKSTYSRRYREKRRHGSHWPCKWQGIGATTLLSNGMRFLAWGFHETQ